MGSIVWAVIAAAGIPSALVGVAVWRLEKDMDKRGKEREEKEKNREQMELHLIQTCNAALALGEATAKAVQRIPDAHCNGDMHAALEYAAKVKHEQKDFLYRKGVQAIV